MKTAEKLATGWLLTLGFMFMTLSVSAVIEKNTILQPIPPGAEETQEFINQDALYVLDNTALYGLIFGVPTSVLGIWMALELARQSRQEKKLIQEQKSDRLQSVFYRLVQENRGRVTVLNFAMQSQLPAARAKQYLDEQAKLFNANFKVNEDGGVSYHFDV
jgi:H+/gluconate symporter-like permease